MWVYLYMCGYVEKYHICGLKVWVRIIREYLWYVFPSGEGPSDNTPVHCTHGPRHIGTGAGSAKA